MGAMGVASVGAGPAPHLRPAVTHATPVLEPRSRSPVRGLTRQAGGVPSSPPARVLTFNVGRGAVGRRWGASPPGATFERLDEVAEAVARTEPEVVALQEVHEGDVPELLRLLDERHGLAFHGAFAAALPAEHPRLVRLADPTRHSPFGLALLSTSPLTDERVVALPDDGVEPRVAHLVRTGVADHEVTVINLHLSTDGGGIGSRVRGHGSPRAEQTEAVLALAAGEHGPLVVLGDWNQEAVELALVLRRLGLRRRLRFASDPWTATTLKGNGIDHVLVAGGLRRRYRGVERSTVSDHRPVLVSLDPPT